MSHTLSQPEEIERALMEMVWAEIYASPTDSENNNSIEADQKAECGSYALEANSPYAGVQERLPRSSFEAQ